MKVLYIADQYSNGGAARALIELVVLLRDHYGVEPIVGTAFNDALAEELDKYGIAHIYLGHRQFSFNYNPRRGKMHLMIKRPFYWLRYIFANRVAIRNAKRSKELIGLDLVHSNVNRNDVGGLIAKIYKVPHIWHIREFTSGHFNLVFNRRKPFKYMNNITDRFIAISNVVADEWEKLGLCPEKTQTIYDGINVGSIKKHGTIDERKLLRIICTGEISESKGQVLLVEALGRCAKNNKLFYVDIYGNGENEYLEYLMTKINDLGLSHYIKLKGYSSNINNLLHFYDIGINTSSREGFGRTTVEYMAANLITMVKEDDIANEILDDGACGYTFKNANHLSDLLIWVDNNRDEAYKKGNEARERAIELFDINKNASAFFDLYRNCIG